MSKGAETRHTILNAAFDLIYKNGYQATSIDEILKMTHVTKGSFFHHFKNKEIMGLAMIEEIIYPGMHQMMIDPLRKGKDPILEIYKMMKGLLTNHQLFNVKYGCPAINLIDEMAASTPSFNKAQLKLTTKWENAIIKNLENAKASGQINSKTDTKRVALFIMSGYAGIRNLGKLYGKNSYSMHLSELKLYLNNL